MHRLAATALGPWGPVDPVARTGSGVIRSRGGEQVMVFAKSSTGYEGQYVRMWEDMVEPGLGAAMLVQVCAQVASDYLLLLFMCFPMPRPFPCLFFPADFKVFPSAVTTMAMIQGPGGGRGIRVLVR